MKVGIPAVAERRSALSRGRVGPSLRDQRKNANDDSDVEWFRHLAPWPEGITAGMQVHLDSRRWAVHGHAVRLPGVKSPVGVRVSWCSVYVAEAEVKLACWSVASAGEVKRVTAPVRKAGEYLGGERSP
jgi:hypothetical protein